MAAHEIQTVRQSKGQSAKGILLFALGSMLFAGITVSAQRGAGLGGAAQPHPAIGDPQAIAEGEKLYNETCTSCHGKDGTGGELGPPVAAQNRRYLRRTDQEIFDTIKNGITGTQMPPYGGRFTDDQVWRVTAYIHGLRGTAIDTPAAGDVAGGEAIFWGKANCGSCHMVKAKGGILGPDLSNLAGTRKVQNIVDALTKEKHKIAADGGTHDTTLLPMTNYQPVRVTTADGKVISGILKNEDSFSLQVLGKDDLNLYRFKRNNVKVFYDPQSLMPHDWDKRLTPVEFQNLLAFLTRLYVPSPAAPAGRGGGAVGN
ncbi:MAG TPA: c-type cytochrome [Vicinamibacterales bacterium]|nr:c-type cytochrome [Vicinamibacterales bacterium]